MAHREISSEEEVLGEFYADIFSYCLSNTYTSVSEDDSSSEYSSDSEDMNIRSTIRPTTLVIDSDTLSEHETQGAGERSLASIEEWVEDISRKLEDFTGMSSVTLDYYNPLLVKYQT